MSLPLLKFLKGFNKSVRLLKNYVYRIDYMLINVTCVQTDGRVTYVTEAFVS
jgi:hypothetical protein